MKTDKIDVAALKILKNAKHLLTKQQYKTLRGQILAGDSDGAIKGLGRILRRRDGYAPNVTVIDEIHGQEGAEL